jgi:hypothetical protein
VVDRVFAHNEGCVFRRWRSLIRRTTADDLLELGHRLNRLVEQDHLESLRIRAGRHQLGHGHDNRERELGIDAPLDPYQMGCVKRLR